LKPRPASAQAFEQRHVGNIGQIARPRSRDGLAQRTALRQVNQQDAQQGLYTRKSTQSTQRTQFHRLALPLRGKQAGHHAPVLFNTGDSSCNQPFSDCILLLELFFYDNTSPSVLNSQ
jgi:hypothetical protein